MLHHDIITSGGAGGVYIKEQAPALIWQVHVRTGSVGCLSWYKVSSEVLKLLVKMDTWHPPAAFFVGYTYLTGGSIYYMC